MDSLKAIFDVEGALHQHLPGFTPRPQQQDMAKAILETLNARETLVAEAGTGTGKTLAYLIPAILSKRKIVVSTATKTLQDQLFRKDLPLIRKALDLPFKAALLKGRANYLCLYRLENHLGLHQGQGSQDAYLIERIRRWSRTTLTGDIAELSEVPENSPHWQGATSTLDNCLGAECKHYGDCLLVKARSRAKDADLVVVNHHLLWADWNLRNEGQGELLPLADGIVVDEAHQFQESASQFLGSSLRSAQLIELVRDIQAERVREAPEALSLDTEALRLARLTQDLRIALGDDYRREPWGNLQSHPPALDAVDALSTQLSSLKASLGTYAQRGKGLESCELRTQRLFEQLASFMEAGNDNQIQWFETRKQAFSLNQSPIRIDSAFNELKERFNTAWIFTSATLTHRGQFDHFIREIGLGSPRTEIWESPFDYAQNARFYVPENLPDPRDPSHTKAIIRAAIPLIQASEGRAFMLFTSHQALRLAAELLPEHLSYPLFVQGAESKIRLLEAFKSSGNGILLGTSTFWEGVDVPGPQLSLVIIDKLPFASPSDPVLGAKLDSLKSAGLNPFVYHQLPRATLVLKQGVGRLVRGMKDRGVIMLCDTRILEKNYGKSMMESLPGIPLTRKLPEVCAFLETTLIDQGSF